MYSKTMCHELTILSGHRTGDSIQGLLQSNHLQRRLSNMPVNTSVVIFVTQVANTAGLSNGDLMTFQNSKKLRIERIMEDFDGFAAIEFSEVIDGVTITSTDDLL